MIIIVGQPKPTPAFKKNAGITPENTWLIFGCSPFINEVKQHIPALLKKYRNIGLNSFPLHFSGCEYICSIDKNASIYPRYSGSKHIIGWDKCSQRIKEFHKTTPVEYIFRSVIDEPVLIDTFKWTNKENLEFNIGNLLCRHTIALPAINYALLQGAKNIVLIGVDFSAGWNHFYDKPKSVNIRRAHHAKLRQNRMLNLLAKLNKRVNIYNINPSASTNVPIISIEELNV